MGMYEDIDRVIIPYVEGLLKDERTERICNAFNGWEKWFQGEFLLNLNNTAFQVSQEDNIYAQSSGSTADFVLKNQGRQLRDYVTDTCIVEIKCMTLAQANGDTSKFADSVKIDIDKLLAPLKVAAGNPIVVRLMIVVTFATKAGVISGKLREWQRAVEQACDQVERAGDRPKEHREAPDFKAPPKTVGKLSAFFIYWKQRV